MKMIEDALRENDGEPLALEEKAMYNLRLNDIILSGQSKGKIQVYAP